MCNLINTHTHTYTFTYTHARSHTHTEKVSGFTIVAERINFLRYLSHFRSVHRGQFFTTMKTTAVRKLLPESWGFLCPVHTPDGAPCGLLNHLATTCRVVSGADSWQGTRTSSSPEVKKSKREINDCKCMKVYVCVYIYSHSSFRNIGDFLPCFIPPFFFCFPPLV